MGLAALKILFQRKTVPFFSYFLFRILFMVHNKGTKLTIQITRKNEQEVHDWENKSSTPLHLIFFTIHNIKKKINDNFLVKATLRMFGAFELVQVIKLFKSKLKDNV